MITWENWYKNTPEKALSLFLFSGHCLLHFFIFSHAFLCKQSWQPYHKWCSSLWLKHVKSKAQYSRLFWGEGGGEGGEMMGMRLQHSILGATLLSKIFLSPKILYFSSWVKSTQQILSKVGHCNCFFCCSYLLRQNEGGWVILMFFLLFVSFLYSRL